MSSLAYQLVRAWRHRGPIAILLLPFASLYGLASTVHRQLFRTGLMPVRRLSAKVVVVGNVITGGAGKTPTVIAIVQHLTAHGVKVGVVSRGYGRADRQVRGVSGASLPAEVGDEPLLIFNTTKCPMFVGQSRHAAACALLCAHPDVEVIVCDDGLQHYGLYRDLEVVVFDDRGVGNGWLLPAGPLREAWPRKLLRQCGQRSANALTLHTGKRASFAGFKAHRELAPYAVSMNANHLALRLLGQACDKPLFAVAGIAQPEVFFNMLTDLQIPLAGTLALPDHFDFHDFDASLGQRYALLCTEKDAAKLWPLAPDALAVPLLQTIEADFWSAFDAALGMPAKPPLSSLYGHKTT